MSTIVSRIRDIIDYKGISERKFSTEIGVSSGFLSKVSDVGSSKVAKIVSIYPEINPVWLLTGEGEMIKSANETDSEESTIISDNKRFLEKYFQGRLLPNHYEYTMVKYYDAFSDKRVEELLSLEIDVYEERYSDYAKLVNFLLSLDPPEFFLHKFISPPPFDEEIRKEKEDFEEDVIGLKCVKLKNILFILRAKNQAEHFSFATSKLIKYLDTYKGIIKNNFILNQNKDTKG